MCVQPASRRIFVSSPCACAATAAEIHDEAAIVDDYSQSLHLVFVRLAKKMLPALRVVGVIPHANSAASECDARGSEN